MTHADDPENPGTERVPRAVRRVVIQCVCGYPATGDTVGDAEADHLRHILDDHDLPGVTAHQYRETLDRKDPRD